MFDPPISIIYTNDPLLDYFFLSLPRKITSTNIRFLRRVGHVALSAIPATRSGGIAQQTKKDSLAVKRVFTSDSTVT